MAETINDFNKVIFNDQYDTARAIEILYYTTHYHYTVVLVKGDSEETIIGFANSTWQYAANCALYEGYSGKIKVVNNRTGKLHFIHI